MSEQQKEELERIIREVYNKRYFEFRGYRLFYKLKYNRFIEYISMYLPTEYEQEEFTKLLLNQDQRLEYALYIFSFYNIRPSWVCLTHGTTDLALDQFVPSSHYPKDFEASVIKLLEASMVDLKDPLSQIFIYRVLISDRQQVYLLQHLYHFYLCPVVVLVEPYILADISSIFEYKEGLVAYCTTLADFINLWLRGVIKNNNAREQFLEIRGRAIAKLHKLLEEGESKEKICSINFIKRVVRDEIEEANKLMQKYRIVRVAVPLV